MENKYDPDYILKFVWSRYAAEQAMIADVRDYTIYIENQDKEGEFFIVGFDKNNLKHLYRGNLQGMSVEWDEEGDLSKANLGKVFVKFLKKIDKKFPSYDVFWTWVKGE
jgi:hypothetical protein